MEHFTINDEFGNSHLVFIGWNRLLANDRIGIFVHCPTKPLSNSFYHHLGAFSEALQKTFKNDQLIKVR